MKNVTFLLLLIGMPIFGMEKEQTTQSLQQEIHAMIVPAEKVKESRDDLQFCLQETRNLINNHSLLNQGLSNIYTHLGKIETSVSPFKLSVSLQSLQEIILLTIPLVEQAATTPLSPEEKIVAERVIGKIVLANNRMEPFRIEGFNDDSQTCLDLPPK